MIDVSDGLLLDLERITVEQGVGARLHMSRIPVSREYSEHVSGFSDDFYGAALSGGEDYELLFTSPAARREELREISSSLEIEITEIGEVTEEPLLTVLGPDGNEISVKRKGFIHFGN
jgi:thiamine-monophosphate kinase